MEKNEELKLSSVHFILEKVLGYIYYVNEFNG